MSLNRQNSQAGTYFFKTTCLTVRTKTIRRQCLYITDALNLVPMNSSKDPPVGWQTPEIQYWCSIADPLWSRHCSELKAGFSAFLLIVLQQHWGKEYICTSFGLYNCFIFAVTLMALHLCTVVFVFLSDISGYWLAAAWCFLGFSRLPQASPSPEIFKAWQEKALTNLIYLWICPCLGH